MRHLLGNCCVIWSVYRIWKHRRLSADALTRPLSVCHCLTLNLHLKSARILGDRHGQRHRIFRPFLQYLGALVELTTHLSSEQRNWRKRLRWETTRCHILSSTRLGDPYEDEDDWASSVKQPMFNTVESPAKSVLSFIYYFVLANNLFVPQIWCTLSYTQSDLSQVSQQELYEGLPPIFVRFTYVPYIRFHRRSHS